MPIYEYQCEKCDHEFEREQRIVDPPVKTCPKCRGRKVTKLISRSSFVLKGGGWYADGYGDSKKSDASSDAASDASKEKTESTASDSTSSEGKSSDKSDEKPKKKTGSDSTKTKKQKKNTS
jgi:putative FmdB family regulatory protein